MTSDFVRLDAHLARMQISAAALGLSFDEAAARAALDGAVAGRTGPLRVRLTLDEQGAHRATALISRRPATLELSGWRRNQPAAATPLLRHKTSWREAYDQPHPDC